jgi:hypothetical protein
MRLYNCYLITCMAATAVWVLVCVVALALWLGISTHAQAQENADYYSKLISTQEVPPASTPAVKTPW